MDYPFKYYSDVLNKYATFDGRARRAEYWYFFLFNILIGMGFGIVDSSIGSISETGTGLLSGLYTLAIVIPNLAVTVRRLHDIGKSGWMILVAFIPLIGFFWLLILLAADSEREGNKYGPNPKATVPTPTPTQNF